MGKQVLDSVVARKENISKFEIYGGIGASMTMVLQC